MKKVILLGVGLPRKTILYDLIRSDLVSEIIAADVGCVEGRKPAESLFQERENWKKRFSKQNKEVCDD